MSQLFGFPSGLSGGSKETEYTTNFNTNHSTSYPTNYNTSWNTSWSNSNWVHSPNSYMEFAYGSLNDFLYNGQGSMYLAVRLAGADVASGYYNTEPYRVGNAGASNNWSAPTNYYYSLTGTSANNNTEAIDYVWRYLRDQAVSLISSTWSHAGTQWSIQSSTPSVAQGDSWSTALSKSTCPVHSRNYYSWNVYYLNNSTSSRQTSRGTSKTTSKTTTYSTGQTTSHITYG